VEVKQERSCAAHALREHRHTHRKHRKVLTHRKEDTRKTNGADFANQMAGGLITMTTRRIVVLGGGFAGLWSALGAARKLDELGVGADAAEVLLINRDTFHSIRVRNYEGDLSQARVPLDDVLDPVGIRHLEAQITGIDCEQQVVTVRGAGGRQDVRYDRLVFALGSQLVRPDLPGLAEYAFDIDTYDGAARLSAHLQALARIPASLGQFTVVVVGGGLTGIEAACEMPERLRDVLAKTEYGDCLRVILADHQAIGSDMGRAAQPVIREALATLGIETLPRVRVVSVGPEGLVLDSGEKIAAATVVWCAGMHANPLTEAFPVERDRWGRLPVDEFMQVKSVRGVFAAGDSAWALMDDCHPSVMSCQHARPMGRFAGHNVVCDLLGLPMLPLRIDWYVTVLDLGAAGALYTEGWDRRVVATGETAKSTKRLINGQRIYPPMDRDSGELLAAAAPIVQAPPDYRD
jgi:NADH dehydrogenase